MPFTHASPRLYLTIARKLGSTAQANLTAATYVASLAELSAVSRFFDSIILSTPTLMKLNCLSDRLQPI